eukprot:snap_masked-scaffold_9-processed-gene-11.34-mRNA-1 protein AED:1.00 eAED:1.00 QI:0/0/0/0/1/1/2/0/72
MIDQLKQMQLLSVKLRILLRKCLGKTQYSCANAIIIAQDVSLYLQDLRKEKPERNAFFIGTTQMVFVIYKKY